MSETAERIELLQSYFDREMNVVFSLSSDYMMNTPRKGCEKELGKAKENVCILSAMLAELRMKAEPEM